MRFLKRLFFLAVISFAIGGWTCVIAAQSPIQPYFSDVFPSSDLMNVTTDSSGNIYFYGNAVYDPVKFPTAKRIGVCGQSDLLIMKISPDGKTLVWATFIGGTSGDIPLGGSTSFAVDTDGSVVFGGMTGSHDFPTKNPIIATRIPGGFFQPYGVLGRLSSDGSQLVFSTYFGGPDWSEVRAVAIGPTGDIFAGGPTGDGGMPASVNAFNGGYTDAFVSRLPSDGSKVYYTRYIGGNDKVGDSTITEYPLSLIVDQNNAVVMFMLARSTDMVTTVGAYQRELRGSYDQFFAKILPNGTLKYATYFGGSQDEWAWGGMKKGPSDTVYSMSYTSSNDFPAINSSPSSSGEVGMVQVDTNGTPIFSRRIPKSTYGGDFVVDAGGEIHKLGGAYDYSAAALTPDAYKSTFGSNKKALYQIYSEKGDLIYGTLFGGNVQEDFESVSIDPFGDIIGVGVTDSSDFPHIGGGFFSTWDRSAGGNMLVKFSSKTVSMAAGTITIGEAGPANIVHAVVQRGGLSTSRFQVNYSITNGTALNGTDFTASNGVLTWNDGETANKVIDIPIVDDSTVEADKTFFIDLSSPTNGTRISPLTRSTVTIVSDDVGFQFSKSTFSFTEIGGSVSAVVRRLGNSSGAVSVKVAPENRTALNGIDFTASTNTLTWAAGDAADKNYTFTIVGDTQCEPNKAFQLYLREPNMGVVIGTNPATVEINDNDRTVTLDPSGSLVVNEDTGTVRFAIHRCGGQGAIFAEVSDLQRTAKLGSDYNFQPLQFNWANGDVSDKFIDLRVVDDNVFEPAEVMDVFISNVTPGVIAGNWASVTIQDDDPQGPGVNTVQFSATAQGVPEDSLDISVQIDKVGTGDVTVNYETRSGTAIDGVDFIGGSGTLHWASGDENPKFLSFSMINDAVAEGNETLSVLLSSPSAGLSITGVNPLPITILDEESTVRLTSLTPDLAEDAPEGKAAFKVERLGNPYKRISVDYAILSGSATTTGQIGWNAGHSDSVTIYVPILNDTIPEETESIVFSLSNPTGGLVIPATEISRTVFIRNDDYPTVSVPSILLARLSDITHLTATVTPSLSNVRYQWSQISGPLVQNLGDADTRDASAVFNQPGTHVFAFSVDIGRGFSERAQTRVDVSGIQPQASLERTINIFSLSDPNGRAVMVLSLEQPGSADVRILDRFGREVNRFVWDLPAGASSVYWNGTDSTGRQVNVGVYKVFVKTSEGNQRFSVVARD